MKRDWNTELERSDGTGAEGTNPFLQVLRERMEESLIRDAEEPRKVGLSDYLKLATLLEVARATSTDDVKEVVVRWEDPYDEVRKDSD